MPGIVGMAVEILLSTLRDVFPIVSLLLCFQLFVLRVPIPHWPRVVFGLALVVAGLALFVVGLELAIFPLGKLMATQLSAPHFGSEGELAPSSRPWWVYGWVYAFGALIGFAASIAEPALIAVAHKANEVSRGTISQWGLRIFVAVGAAVGVALGTFRIVTGTPLYAYIIAGYAIVVFQTIYAPKMIVPLAYDAGGVTTSTVTVPLVAAIGLGLSATIPGRNPLIDGFGMVALACMVPMMTVMGYAQFVQWRADRRKRQRRRDSLKFKTIVCMVKTHLTESVVTAAKAAGGTGATIIPARGTGIHEARTFFGLTLEAQTDVVLFLLEEHLVDAVVVAISEAGEFIQPGTGIAFVLPVDKAVGMESQTEHFARLTREKGL